MDLPATGMDADALFEQMRQLKEPDADWTRGRTFSLVYPTGRDDVDEVLKRANLMYLYENALNLIRFPSLGAMQQDCIEMTGSLVNMPDSGRGAFTSGGTESIFMSVLASREHARRKHPLTRGNIVFPESAHPAFAKAAYYLDLEARPTALGSGFAADPDALADAVDDQTVLIAGSAYGNPHGIIDPIETLSAIALERGIPFHSDTCIGAFVLPFMERLGIEVPIVDFRLPGVTAMSADIHKYGYSTKGASTILYRDAAMIGYQSFEYSVWPSGRYRTPTMAGARAAAPIAAAWAVMNYLGEDGYLDIMSGLMATVAVIRDGITAIEGLRILGDPIGPLLSFTSDTQDVFAICDGMDDRGWNLNRIASPNGLHMMISPIHGKYAEEFLRDLRQASVNCGASRGIGAGYN